MKKYLEKSDGYPKEKKTVLKESRENQWRNLGKNPERIPCKNPGRSPLKNSDGIPEGVSESISENFPTGGIPRTEILKLFHLATHFY